jgi:hypothetical protein
MKKYSLITNILGLTCAGLILIGCETTTQPGAATATTASPNSGHVLIYRVANFGTDLSLVVSVDGKDVGNFTEGRNYDGYLPAGQHTITIRVDPNRTATAPAQKTLTVQAGKTYVYTATWSGQNLALVLGH